MSTTHWCYHCSEPVWPQGHYTLCPYCNQGFLQPLHDPSPAHGHLSSAGMCLHLSSIFGTNPYFDHPVPLPEHPIPCPMLPFHDPLPIIIPNRSHSPIDVPYHDPYSYFHDAAPAAGYGSSMDEELVHLAEQLSVDDAAWGPPPADQTAIDALPTVAVSHSQLNREPQCPVCQEKFKRDKQVRRMPCKHIYHSDCIVEWLSQHNSCPVCRVELPPDGSPKSGSESGNTSSSSSFRRRRSRNLFSCFSLTIEPIKTDT